MWTVLKLTPNNTKDKSRKCQFKTYGPFDNYKSADNHRAKLNNSGAEIVCVVRDSRSINK